MRFVALAAGFDGTLAHNGRYDDRCVEALKALAVTGRKLILVTARELRELLEIFPPARVFDYIVAENGAVMHQPASRESEILAQAPSEILLQELERRRIAPLNVGSSIITTSLANESEVRDAIHKLHLDCQLVANDGSLIVLPAGVNKASGVREALRQLGVSAHNLVVIGDAQNDLALFHLAEHSVAVQNADESLKQCADRTTSSAYCDGFLELARDLMDGDLAYAPPKVRISLGHRRKGDRSDSRGGGFAESSLAPYYDSLLVCGSRGQGKTLFTNRLFGELHVRGYQCCVIGADLCGADSPRPVGMRVFGHAYEAPRLSEIMSALEHPTESIAVNLAALPAESRPVFADALLLQLQALHDRVGRPHSVLVHQAHWLLPAALLSTSAARWSEMTMVYSSAEPQRLPPEILEGVSTVIALGESAQVPDQFSGFGDTSHIDVEIPSSAGLVTRSGQIWIRGAQRGARAEPAQATAGGAVCVIRGLAEEESDPADSDELSSLSGY